MRQQYQPPNACMDGSVPCKERVYDILNFYNGLCKVVKKIENAAGAISIIFALIVMVMLSVNVFSRYFLHKTIYGAEEYATVFLMIITYFGLIYTTGNDRHMRMTIFFNKYPERIKHIAMFFFFVLIAILFSSFLYAGWGTFIKAITQNETSPAAVTVYRWPGRLAVVVGSAFTIIQSILFCIKEAIGVFASKSEKEED